jgi:hypothetical protein
MTHLPVPETRPDVEVGLTRLFSAPAPDAAFVDRLERELRTRAAEQRPVRRSWLVASPRQQWAVGALALALVLALALAIVGPRRVLAQFQQLLGYVPGVGFVDLEATRVLTAPVQVTRGGVTLRITQVLAKPDETLVVFEAEGLPAYEVRQVNESTEQDLTAALRLPGGSTLTGARQSVGRGNDTVSGSLRFAPLPTGVFQATLLLARLPYVEHGTAPEDWEVPLTLRLATGEVVAALFPQPYVPVEAEDTQRDITLRVLVVAHSPEATVLKLQAEWADPTWRFGFFTAGQDLRLSDDLGHSYGPPVAPSHNVVVQHAIGIPSPPDGTVTPAPGLYRYEIDQSFASLSPSATRLTLPVEAITFDVPVPMEFEVDLGPQPQVGQAFPLDIPINAAGVPLRITGARLEREQRGAEPPETWLRFDIVVEPAPDGRSVRGLHFLVGTSTPAFDGGSTGYQFAPERLDAALRLKADQPLPTGPVRIYLAAASLVVPGPWELTWDVPGRTAPPSAPVTLSPSEASQTHSGLTLRAEGVTLTDRVTVVELALEDAPAGTQLHQVTCWLPQQNSPDCWLEDNRGNRYSDPGVSWQTSTQPLTDTLVYGAAQPLAQSMTLHVPAVEIAVDSAANFDVDVPGEGAAGMLDQPWAVDIPVDVARQSLRFSQAWLTEMNGLPQMVLRSDPLETPSDRWLTGLRLAAITDPEGELVDLTLAHSSAGPDFFSLERSYVAVIIIPVGGHDNRSIRPGRYHVELSGVTLGVRGPWTLRWELPGP